jgi:hypothetical protein
MKNHGSLEDFRLVLHGTAEVPHHMKAGPRIYDENYNTVQNERSVSYKFIIARWDDFKTKISIQTLPLP